MRGDLRCFNDHILKNLTQGNYATQRGFAATNEKRLRRDSTLIFFGNLNRLWKSSHRGQQFIEQLRMKPFLGFMFADCYDLPIEENIAGCPCRSLPSNCASTIMGNIGLVQDQKEIGTTRFKVTCIFIPEEEDVTIKVMSAPVEPWNPDEIGKISRKRRLKKFPIITDIVNCMIFLTSNDEALDWNPLRCIPRDRYKSFCGGVMTTLGICHRDETGHVCNEPKAWIGILISGPSVRSWSVVLRKTDNTKEKVEAKIRLLKSQVELKKHSVGLAYGCLARGPHMFGEKHVESKIFKNLFPQVPLIGTLGEAQYGDSAILPGIGHRYNVYSTTECFFQIIQFLQSLGEVDFYLNGGDAVQPDSSRMTKIMEACSHVRLYVYFTESIYSAKLDPTKCDTWDTYRTRQCAENKVLSMDTSQGRQMNRNIEQFDPRHLSPSQPCEARFYRTTTKMDVMNPVDWIVDKNVLLKYGSNSG